jgi:hypothetical protein
LERNHPSRGTARGRANVRLNRRGRRAALAKRRRRERTNPAGPCAARSRPSKFRAGSTRAVASASAARATAAAAKHFAYALHYPPLLDWRALAQVAVNRVRDDAPLRSCTDETEGREGGLTLERKPDAELRVLLNLFSGSHAGWRAPAPSPCLRCVSGHGKPRKRHGVRRLSLC